METLSSTFAQYGAWTWWILGFALLAIEIFHPFSIAVWFGLGALAIGGLSLAIDWPWQVLFLVWAAVSAILLIIGRRLFRRDAVTSEDPLLNDRAGRLVGRVYTLAEPLGENGGHLAVDDSIWRIRGPLLAAGTRVVIRSVEGTVLVVEAAS